MDIATIEQNKQQTQKSVSKLLLKLKEKDISIVTAESATGGTLIKHLLDIPTFGKHIYGGYVAYSNKSKENMLNVKNKNTYSLKTANEMSRNALTCSSANLSIAIIGHAGPIEFEQLGLTIISVSIKLTHNIQYINSFDKHDFTYIIDSYTNYSIVTFTKLITLDTYELITNGDCTNTKENQFTERVLILNSYNTSEQNNNLNFITYVRQILQLNMVKSACDFAYKIIDSDTLIYYPISKL